MIYHALAADFDGTLAHDGVVDEATVDALERLRESGRKLLLVTGRRLDSLLESFPRAGLFDSVVAENGALLYWPESGEETALADPPPPEFVEMLKRRGVDSVEAGRVIVATWSPHEGAVLEAIRELALERQIIFNKGAVMVLPSGVNKAFGLRAALRKMRLSPINAVGVGDAENDESLLALCGVSAAVANALPIVKQSADIVTQADHGAGVAELIERMIDNDLWDVCSRPESGIEYGVALSGEPLVAPPFGESMLVVGGPGGGKSRFATSFWERLAARGYQTCVIDPEGDYQASDKAVIVGTRSQAPALEEVLQIVGDPEQDCVVSLFSVEKDERPRFFGGLVRALLDHRSRTGRPHWIIVDEAHYAAPSTWRPAKELSAQELRGMIFISAFPDRVSDSIYEAVGLLIAIGDEPRETLQACLERLGRPTADLPPPEDQQEHRALSWRRDEGGPRWFRRIPPAGDSRRHVHEYFDGELEEQYQFRFRGPDDRVNLRAQNLRIFLQLAEGVDDATWEHHLRRGDYSAWFRDVIKDADLATQVDHVQRARGLSSARARELIIAKVRERYDEAG